MGGITLGKNVSALRAIRDLSRATSALETVSERLSSGLRINKASDDPAGLAVATSLNAGSRILGQGIRNLNDGISLTNVAEGALSALQNITARQLELATEAANGPLNAKQRVSLQNESDALVKEFNRIVQTTTFNGINVIDAQQGPGTVRIQFDAGSNGGIDLSLAQSLSRTAGTGTIANTLSFAPQGPNARQLITGDFDGDGKMDIAYATSYGGLAYLCTGFGNGDGTFKVGTSYAFNLSTSTFNLTAADMNGDHVTDIIIGDTQAGSGVEILLGQSNRTFLHPPGGGPTYYSAAGPNTVSVGDVNGDGIMDVMAPYVNYSSYPYTSTLLVLLGNGDGSLRAAISTNYGANDIFFANSVTLADVNGDGKADLLMRPSANQSNVGVAFGKGDGTFGSLSYYGLSGIGSAVTVADVNRDGYLDILARNSGTNSHSILLGNGDGTFKAYTNVDLGGTSYVGTVFSDINGDGLLDIVSASSVLQRLAIRLGNGDGTFGAVSTYSTGLSTSNLLSADFNGDGVADFINNSTTTLQVYLQTAASMSQASYVTLSSVSGARSALTTLASQQQRISDELGRLGSSQSRFQFAMNALQSRKIEYDGAADRIMSADVAEESARLVSTQIRQQAAAAVLAQANTEPALVLKLLSG